MAYEEMISQPGTVSKVELHTVMTGVPSGSVLVVECRHSRKGEINKYKSQNVNAEKIQTY